MADDKYTNEDPEERDDQFDDDEDFGLPDLEYDELDEDEGIEDDTFGDLGSDFDSEPAEEEVIPKVSASREEVPSVSKVEEKEEDVEISDSDLMMSDDSEDWEKELEMELESELQEDDSPGFYEEESYEDFDSSNEEAPVKSVFDSDKVAAKDDVFAGGGFKSAEPAPKAAAPSFKESYAQKSVAYQAYNEDESGNKGKFVRTVVIGTVALVLIGSLFYWLSTQFDGSKKVAKKEEPKKEVVPVVEKPIEKPIEKPVETPKPVEPVAGVVTKLEQPSGKTYIIVGSFFDDDLATDYANELADKGQSPFVIPPYKTSKFFRVAIAGYDSFDAAKTNIEGFKAEYGQDIWPLRY